MLDPSTVFSNIDALLNVKIGSSLIADANGRLQIDPSKRNPLFSFFSSDAKRVNTVVNQTCQQLFDGIIRKNPSPLSSNSLPLKNDRVQIKKILESVSKIGQHILNPQLESNLHELINTPETLEARLALQQGIHPTVLNQTISGTYVMHNRQGKPWGIFKPQCQEVGGNKNPSWFVWALAKAEQWGIDTGTGYLRECAAYQLDKKHIYRKHFSKVPLTVPTHFQHPTLDTSLFPLHTPDLVGSFQLFKDNCEPGSKSLKFYEFHRIDLHNYLPKMLANFIHKTITVVYRCLFYLGIPHLAPDEIHKMAIIDIRLLNCDRHLANFLVDKDTKKVYPIDHGLVLPGKAHRLRFDWKFLIHSRIPFTKETLDYIKMLNPARDERILRKCGITSVDVIERMKLSTLLLQIAAERGLTLYEIADLMLKKDASNNQYFEKVICKKVIREGKDPELVINQAIDEYL